MDAAALATSLIVQVREREVDLVLQVTNVSRDPVAVRFATAQSYDFVVSRGSERVWSWAADRMFAQALREEALAPEATWRYEATWAPESLPPGAYAVEAQLTSTSHPRSARAEFQIP